MSELPLISAVCLTADRSEFVQTAIEGFLAQTYPNKELIVYDSGEVSAHFRIVPGVRHVSPGFGIRSIGALRNAASWHARGEYLAHWDDDDIYATDRLERQFEFLKSSGADIVGADTAIFHSRRGNNPPAYYLYRGDRDGCPVGSTLFYRKSTWQERMFEDVPWGEEEPFTRGRKIAFQWGHVPIMLIARDHDKSTSRRAFHDPEWLAARSLNYSPLGEVDRLRVDQFLDDMVRRYRYSMV